MKTPYFLGMAAASMLLLTQSAGASELNYTAVQISSIVPTQFIFIGIIATIVLLVMGITQKDATKTLWINLLAFICSIFTMGCSWGFGDISVNPTASTDPFTLIIYTNNGILIFAAALFFYAFIMLIWAVLAQLMKDAQEVDNK
jgi:hypothetical protein